MSTPMFEELADFIREFSGLSSRKIISPTTLFEKDLGITGDDGHELLIAVDQQFNSCLTAHEDRLLDIFGLGPDEHLFHSEGWGFPPLWWFGIGKRLIIHKFTVGELYEAICQTTRS